MLCSLLFFTVFLAPEPSPVAMVLDVSGEVTLQREKGKPRPARVMQMLFSGDRLKTGNKGGIAIIFMDADRRERLGANVEATVKAAGCAPPGTVEKLPPEQQMPIRNGLKTLVISERGSVRLFRAEPEAEPPAVTPIAESRVLSDRPDLSWSKSAKAQGYRVQLTIAGSGKLLWSEKSSIPSLKYPAKQKELRRGRSYEWSVYADEGDDLPRLLSKSVFKVASEDEVEDLKQLHKLTASKSSGELLMAALAYHAAGVYGEALTLFERLCERNPDNAEFHASRAEYYERAGRRTNAKRAWKRAKELGYPVPKEKLP